jgi:hypothetical protein
MRIGKRTQVIWWWRWGCRPYWSLRWPFGLWPHGPWKLFRFYDFGAFEIRRSLEDMPNA